MLLKGKVPICFLLAKIKFDFIAIAVYSVIIVFFHDKYIFKDIQIPLAISALFGTAVSLLPAFRTNQAYDRWWEARKVWGAIVNDSRTLIRQVQEFYNGDNKETYIKSFAIRQIAWCHVLGKALRKLDHSEALNKYLDSKDVAYVQKYSNSANAILDLHATALHNALKNNSINQFQQIQLDSTVRRLTDSMGKCERIKNTPFPATYSMMLHLLIYVFAAILPFGLLNYSAIVEISLNILISSMFLLIEKTAVYKEDPFENRQTDISMTSIARTIEINLLQMIDANKIPEPAKSESYYVM